MKKAYQQTEMGLIPEDWEVKKLGEIANIFYGKDWKDIKSEYGNYKVYGTGGIIGRAIKSIYKKPSIIIGRKGTIDKPIYINKPFWCVDTTYYLDINYNNIFYIFLQLKRINLKKLNEATGVPSLNINAISSLQIPLPALPEQQAIAEVLSDMDAEIDALEEKLEKYRLVKKGMMQELLTGKKRLV